MSDDLNMVQPGTADTPDVASTHEWEAVGEVVATQVATVIHARLTPIIRKAADDLYADVLSASEDYLAENVAFNITARLRAAERAVMEAYQLRAQNAALVETIARLLDRLDDHGVVVECMGPRIPLSGFLDTPAGTRALAAAREAIAKATPSDTHGVG